MDTSQLDFRFNSVGTSFHGAKVSWMLCATSSEYDNILIGNLVIIIASEIALNLKSKPIHLVDGGYCSISVSHKILAI